MDTRAHKNMIAARRARQQTTGTTKATSKHSKPDATSNSPAAATASTTVYKSSIGETSTDCRASTPKPKLVNLLSITCYERKALGDGPTIKVFHGVNVVMTIPLQLFQSTSTNAASLVSPQNEVFLAPCMRNPLHRDLESALHLCCAAEALGLLPYIDNTITYQRKLIFRTVPHSTVLAAVEELATASANEVVGEKFISMLAERIAFLIRKNLLVAELDVDGIIHEDEYLAIVSGHPKVYGAVSTINAPWVAQQQAKAAAKARRLAAQERRKQAETRRAERRQDAHEQYKIDMNNRVALLDKLKRQNKVMTLTMEEWELAGRLVGYGDAEIGRFF